MRQRKAAERHHTIDEPLLEGSYNSSGGDGDEYGHGHGYESFPSSPDSGGEASTAKRASRTLPEAVYDLLVRVIKSALSICKGPSKASSPLGPPPSLTPAARERLTSLQQRVQVAFDEKSSVHRRALGMLWELSFKEDTNKDGKACEKWKDMGWQGKDPATDFRGSGFLALENLIWFARAHPTTYDQLLNKTEGRRADWEYPFAAAGCNITFEILDICDLKDSTRDPNTACGRAFLRLLNDSPVAFEAIYAEMFKTLDRVWLERGASYLEFPIILKSAKESIEKRMQEGFDFRADLSDPPDPLPNLTDSQGKLLIEDINGTVEARNETAQPAPESPNLIDF